MPSVEILLITLISLLLVGGVCLLLIHFYKPSKDKSLQILSQQLADSLSRQDNRLGQMSEQLAQAVQNLTTNMNDRLGQSQQLTQQMQKSMAERLDSAGKTMADLRGQLGQLDQATQNVVQVGSEVKKLQDILQRPTLRGGLGEWSLENLLREVLPKQHYTMQHPFKNGTVVDALVHLARGHVAIDAKFPLANFQLMMEAPDDTTRNKLRRSFLKDVCQRIDEIAQKYIRPEEGTLDFALMYIPAENVYYETIINSDHKDPNVGKYGREQRVVPVSPNTLYGYLMVVAAGLRGMQIEKNAHLIRRQLSQITGNLELFINEFALLGKHLHNARSKYDEAGRKLDHFQTRLQQIDTHTPLPDTEPQATQV